MDSTKLVWATGVLLIAVLGSASAQCICNSTTGITAQGGTCSTLETCDAADASCCQPCQWEPLPAQTEGGVGLLFKDGTTPHGYATADLPRVEDSETPRPCGSITSSQFSDDTTTYVQVWAETYTDSVRIWYLPHPSGSTDLKSGKAPGIVYTSRFTCFSDCGRGIVCFASLSVEQVGGGAPVCRSDNVYFCEIAIGSSIKVKFTCDSCENSEQPFYYYIKTQTLDADNDQFCSDSESEQPFPSDLSFVIFPSVDPADEDDDSPGGATSLAVLSPLLIVLTAISTRFFAV